MDTVIANENLTAVVSPLGAELQSIKDSEGTEYLWNGDPVYWTGRAPNLFPYIARLTGNEYTLHGKRYRMGIHGFAWQRDFSLEKQEENAAVFLLEDDASTREMYPFRFALRVVYSLAGSRLNITYMVENRGAGTMYFGIGGHPGFTLPFERGLAFEDYCLEFCEKGMPIRVGFSDACYRTGEDKPYPLHNGTELPLSHSLFDNDAIVLAGAARSVTLKSCKGTKAVRVEYPQMDYLGLWHMPKTDAPYLCIEPWTSLPSRQGVIEELTQQKDLVSLSEGGDYINEWAIEVMSKGY